MIKTDNSNNWYLSPYVLTRFAAKPYQEMTTLEFNRTVANFDRIYELSQQVESTCARLCEYLFEYIEHLEGKERADFVAIKRAVFNKTRPKDTLLHVLTDCNLCDLYEELMLFFNLVQTLEETTKKAKQQFKQELAEKRKLFQGAVQDESFLKALQVANYSLFQNVAKYVQTKSKNIRASERQTESTLWQYFARTTMKTSPFGRLGPVAIAQVDLEQPEVVKGLPSKWQTESFANLNLGLVSFVDKALSRIPAIRTHLPVRLNASLRINGNEISFLRQPKDKKMLLWTNGITVLSRGKLSATIQKLIRFLQAYRPQNPTYADVLSFLETFVRNREQAEAYLLYMIESDLLIVDFPLPSDKFDRMEILRNQVAQIPDETVIAILQKLDRLLVLKSQFATGTIEERSEFLAEMQTIFDELTDIWEPVSQVSGTTHLNMIVEDTILDIAPVKLGRPFFEGFVEDLSLFLECVLARDNGGLAEVVLKDVFTEQYGQNGCCTDLIEFGYQYNAQLNQYLSELLQTEDTIQQKQEKQFAETITKHNNDTAVYNIPQTRLQDLITQFGRKCSKTVSQTVHLQIAAKSWQDIQSGNYLIVLNLCLPGFGNFFTRYTQFFDGNSHRLSRQIQQQICSLQPADTEYIELLSILHNNQQQHAAITPRKIVPPEEYSDNHLDIPIQALSLRHDAKNDRLYLTINGEQSGKSIIPLYLGSFHTGSLPPLHRMLSHIAPTGYQMERIQPNVYTELNIKNREEESSPIRHYPRLCIGKVVIQRERWVFEPEELPPYDKTLDDFSLFFQIYVWSKQHDLPKHMFVHSHAPINLNEPNRAAFKAHKPIYINTHNFFSAKSLQKLLQSLSNGSLQVEEMLPDPEQLFFHIGENRYVTEFQVELNRKPIT